MTHQFKTLDDLRSKIDELEGMLARPTRHMSHPTLYRKRDVGKAEILLKGLRKKDWFFSEDENWVLPHDQMGLSFCADFQNLSKVFKFKDKRNQGAPIHVYWTMKTSLLPDKMQFEVDGDKKGHYFLTITEKMTLKQLVDKLKWIADHMSIIRDVRKAL